MRAETPCAYCGAMFRPKLQPRGQGGRRAAPSQMQRYCSKACAGKGVGATFAAAARARRPPSSLLRFVRCRECDRWLPTKPGKALFCSDDCRRLDNNRITAAYQRAKYVPLLIRSGAPSRRSCKHCGEQFESLKIVVLYCSDSCARKSIKRTRRARKLGVVRLPVNRAAIMERGRWRCHLCGKAIDRSVKVPHPRAGVLDHVLPLALGGDDAPHNLAAAHFLCNSLKGDRPAGEQLRLRLSVGDTYAT